MERFSDELKHLQAKAATDLQLFAGENLRVLVQYRLGDVKTSRFGNWRGERLYVTGCGLVRALLSN